MGKVLEMRHFSRKVTAAALLCCSVFLTSCGNNPTKGQGVRLAKDYSMSVLGKLNGSGGKTPTEPTGDSLRALDAAILTALPGPVQTFYAADLKSFAALLVWDRSHGYVTWTSSTKQSLTFKKGILTATRGLSGDLMSANVDGPASLITARRTGNTQRVNRYLDGEGVTLPITLNCAITRGANETYSAGQITASTVVMHENCTAPGYSFENKYWVDGSGSVLQSHQWISAELGYAHIRLLRR